MNVDELVDIGNGTKVPLADLIDSYRNSTALIRRLLEQLGQQAKPAEPWEADRSLFKITYKSKAPATPVVLIDVTILGKDQDDAYTVARRSYPPADFEYVFMRKL